MDINEWMESKEVNQMNKEEFVQKVGWVFEHSPWVACAAWERIPFESRDTLLQTMIEIVQNAEESKQLALLRAHPDLGTRLQMTEVSQRSKLAQALINFQRRSLRSLFLSISGMSRNLNSPLSWP